MKQMKSYVCFDTGYWSVMILMMLLLFPISSFSQNQSRTNPYGQWLVYTGDNRINKKVGIHSEVQLRNYLLKNTIAQSLVRVGVNWYLDPTVMLTAGYGFFYTTPSPDNKTANTVSENRAWQQVILRHRTKVLFMEHRYRLEQRFIKNVTQDKFTYDTRIRYRFQAIIPLYSLSPHLRHFFVSGNNEIFVNIGRGVSGEIFDRNRLYGGLGYQVSPNLNFQVGYMNQLISVPSLSKADIGHHLQISVAYNMDDIMKTIFSRKENEAL